MYGNHLIHIPFPSFHCISISETNWNFIYILPGDYWIDLGGQWVHGEEDNVAFELAWPTGLLDHSKEAPFKFFSSSGVPMNENAGNNMFAFFLNLTKSDTPEEYDNKSIGDYYKPK